jgi:hypothetical protein
MQAPSRTGVLIDSSTLLTTVTIEWIAPTTEESGGSPVTGYRIQRNHGYDTSISESTMIEIADPTQLTYSYTSGGLLLGVTYKVIIAALNDVYTSNSFA